MKAISELSGLRRALPGALCTEPAAVAADDFNFRTLLEPIRRILSGAGFQHIFADAPRLWREGRGVRQSFNEDLLRALLVAASPPPQTQLNNNWRALDRKIL